VTRESGDLVFEQFVRQLDYPMYVVTTRTEAGPAGCLVGFASEVSIHPPRFLAGLSIRNHTFRAAQHARHLAVHVVSRRHLGLVELFGGRTGDRVPKFDMCAWHAGPCDMPILDDAAGWFVGRIHQRLVLGDHVGHLLEPIAGQSPRGGESLVSLSDVRDLRPGHEA
jgi:flavin reductase (DIM6/NTAB) family NADH-FMN oxidoreductase RutF